jgi:hypothetical protein
MADTSTQSSNPLAPGLSTSEGQLTVAAVFIGVVLEALGGFLTHEQTLHPGSGGWAIAVMLAAVMLQLCTVFGYTKGRSLVKQQALLSGLQVGLPLAVQLAEAVADKLAGKTPTVFISPPKTVIPPAEAPPDPK